MKLAILIVGEYRTFDECRPTMTFLDQPSTPNLQIDVYFSTWEWTTTVNPNAFNDPTFNPYKRKITKEHILKTLNRPATVVIHDIQDYYKNYSITSIMTYGWSLGLGIIRKSNIKYDVVYVYRPDLFYQYPVRFTKDNLLPYCTNRIGIATPPLKHITGMISSDVGFISSFDSINTILDLGNTLKYYQQSEILPWHTYFYEYLTYHNLTVCYFDLVTVEIGRFPEIEYDQEPYWEWDSVHKRFRRIFEKLNHPDNK